MLRHFGCCLTDTDIDARAGRVNPAEKEKTMKTIQTKEMREVVITTYIAKDGKEFDLKSDCIAYEEALDNELLDRYNAIPRRESYAVDLTLPTWYDTCDRVHIIKVRDAQDVETINAWVDRWEDNPNRRTLAENDIGRTILLVYEEYYGYEKSEFCDVIFYEEDILKDVQRALDYINGVEI